MTNYKGKVAIVMGASSAGGMGEATARRLVKEGCHVVISGRSRDSLQAIADEIGCQAFAADITCQARQVCARTYVRAKKVSSEDHCWHLKFAGACWSPCAADQR